jgi:signal transduction histidine kinase
MKLLPENEAPGRSVTEPSSVPTPDEISVVLTRELRGPLSTIEGYLELLANGGVGAVTDEQREYLDVIIRNVHRLSAVVSDWFDVARLEAGRLELVQVPVDLEEVADRAIAQLRTRIRSKEQQVTVDSPSEPVEALGDPRALLHVVDNLLSNAHKYTPPGGAIRFVVAIDGDRSVRLDVIDTGIGIREEDQARLFRKFFRAHLTDAEPGSGLGLTLVLGLLDRMGGRITVQSALGKGSTFSVLLPRAVHQDPASAEDLVSATGGQSGIRPES